MTWTLWKRPVGPGPLRAQLISQNHAGSSTQVDGINESQPRTSPARIKDRVSRECPGCFAFTTSYDEYALTRLLGDCDPPPRWHYSRYRITPPTAKSARDPLSHATRRKEGKMGDRKNDSPMFPWGSWHVQGVSLVDDPACMKQCSA